MNNPRIAFILLGLGVLALIPVWLGLVLPKLATISPEHTVSYTYDVKIKKTTQPGSSLAYHHLIEKFEQSIVSTTDGLLLVQTDSVAIDATTQTTFFAESSQTPIDPQTRKIAGTEILLLFPPRLQRRDYLMRPFPYLPETGVVFEFAGAELIRNLKVFVFTYSADDLDWTTSYPELVLSDDATIRARSHGRVWVEPRSGVLVNDYGEWQAVVVGGEYDGQTIDVGEGMFGADTVIKQVFIAQNEKRSILLYEWMIPLLLLAMALMVLLLAYKTQPMRLTSLLAGTYTIVLLLVATLFWFALDFTLQTSAVIGSGNSVTVTLLLMGLVLFTIVIGINGYLYHTVINPLKALQTVAERMSNGDFSPPLLKPSSHAELTSLNQAFTTMITALKAMMSEKDRLNYSLRHIVEQLPFPILVITHPPDNRTIMVNQQFMRIFGYTTEDVPDTKTWAQQAYPDPVYRAQVMNDWVIAVEQALHSDKAIEVGEYQVITKYKGQRDIVFTTTALDDSLVVAMQDITDINQAKIRLQDSHDRLASALDNAEKANQAKSEFLANMSHEVRTPLNAIIGFSNLALETELTATQQDYLKKISSASHRLSRIIGDILDFSKIEAGKLAMHPAPFKLSESLDHINQLVADDVHAKGLALRIERDANTPEDLLGDAFRIEQVLSNLVSNAIKFTERGEVVLRVTSAPQGDQSDQRTTLNFSVHDTGIGIEPEKIPRLFAPFVQVDSSITRRFEGTGLGLALSKALVELMNGQITVNSTPGRGSTFAFTIPCDLAPSTAAPAAASPTPEITVQDDTDLTLSGKQILVVEDTPLNQFLAMTLLQKAGMEVDVANNGQEGVDKVINQTPCPYAAVLMDIQMPVMDGFEATRVIRQHKSSDELPIIALTAHAISGYREQCLAAGMDDYLTKPINRQLLLDTLLKWINR